MKQLYEMLCTQYHVYDFEQRQDRLAFVSIPSEQLVSLLTCLRDIYGFSHLALMTCVDWLEESRFQLTYILRNHDGHRELVIKSFIDREHAVADSIHHLWQHARVYQRELHEMFGLSFPGSPGMTEPMILEGWQGPPPMRRDFDTLRYCEDNYSNRDRTHSEPEAHMKATMYPED